MMSSVFKFFLTQILLHKIPYGSIVERRRAAAPPESSNRRAEVEFELEATLPPPQRNDSGDALEDESCDSICDDECSLVEVLGHLMQQAVLWIALFYFINVIGVLQVMLWVPFHVACTFATAATAGEALRQTTAYMKRLLVMSIFSNIMHLLLEKYVLHYVLRYLPLEQIEATILKFIPTCVLDTYTRLTSSDKMYLE